MVQGYPWAFLSNRKTANMQVDETTIKKYLETELSKPVVSLKALIRLYYEKPGILSESLYLAASHYEDVKKLRKSDYEYIREQMPDYWRYVWEVSDKEKIQKKALEYANYYQTAN